MSGGSAGFNYEDGDEREERPRVPPTPPPPPRGGRHGREPEDEEPILYKIYRGRVANLMQFGCFVTIEGLKGRREGLVHINEIRKGGRLMNVADAVHRGQNVFVKVLGHTGHRISLSMKEVDQETGADLYPRNADATADPSAGTGGALNPSRPSLGGKAPVTDDEPGGRRRGQRISETEMWELAQLQKVALLRLATPGTAARGSGPLLLVQWLCLALPATIRPLACPASR